MAVKKIKVGSRESILAVKQAEIVMDSIKKNNPQIDTELITFKTKGDKILDKTLEKIGGKGLFTKELEMALLNERIDIAVHSYKDMPYEEVDDLPIVALSEREIAFDVLVLPKNVSEIDSSKPVGSSSQRRSLQFNMLYNGFEIAPIRGNVLTRLSKLDSGEFSAVILAGAGLKRLNLQHRISRVFTLEEMIPSASQGILAVQGRKGEDYSYLKQFHSQTSEIISQAERQFLKTLNGGCTSPVAAYARMHGNEICITGFYMDGFGNISKGNLLGETKDAEKLGEKLAVMLKDSIENASCGTAEFAACKFIEKAV